MSACSKRFYSSGHPSGQLGSLCGLGEAKAKPSGPKTSPKSKRGSWRGVAAPCIGVHCARCLGVVCWGSYQRVAVSLQCAVRPKSASKSPKSSPKSSPKVRAGSSHSLPGVTGAVPETVSFRVSSSFLGPLVSFLLALDAVPEWQVAPAAMNVDS